MDGAVGVIPFVDLVLQKYLIKKDAVKTVGEIFGIDVTFIDEENAKNEKKKKEDNLNYINEIDGESILEESTEFKIGNSVKYLAETGAHASGGISFVSASASALNAANLSVKATQLGARAAQLGARATQLTAKATQRAAEAASEAQNMNIFLKFWYSVTETTSAASKMAASAGVQATAAVQKAASASQSAAAAAQSAAAASSSTTLCRFAGVGFLGLGIVLGVGLGGYFTHKFCEELLDKFVDYYKNNADKLSNSYKKAADYFLMNNEIK